MENKKYLNILEESKLVDTVERIDDFEGIFLEQRDKKDANVLINLYDTYLEIVGFGGLRSQEFLNKRNDLINYNKQMKGNSLNSFQELYKKWKI
jgi:hypothetical protein